MNVKRCASFSSASLMPGLRASCITLTHMRMSHQQRKARQTEHMGDRASIAFHASALLLMHSHHNHIWSHKASCMRRACTFVLHVYDFPYEGSSDTALNTS